MFEGIRGLWHEARGTRLKEELLDAFRHMNAFTEEQSDRCGKALVFLSQQWIEKNGPVKSCGIDLCKGMASELKAQARQRYPTDIGASYGLAIFSLHIKSSCLPGKDANFVYAQTADAIRMASDLIKTLIPKSEKKALRLESEKALEEVMKALETEQDPERRKMLMVHKGRFEAAKRLYEKQNASLGLGALRRF